MLNICEQTSNTYLSFTKNKYNYVLNYLTLIQRWVYKVVYLRDKVAPLLAPSAELVKQAKAAQFPLDLKILSYPLYPCPKRPPES